MTLILQIQGTVVQLGHLQACTTDCACAPATHKHSLYEYQAELFANEHLFRNHHIINKDCRVRRHCRRKVPGNDDSLFIRIVMNDVAQVVELCSYVLSAYYFTL